MQFNRWTRAGISLLSLAGFVLIQTPLLAANAPAAASSSAPKAKAPRVKPYRIAPTQTDVQYGPSKAMVMDFWKAKSETPAPLVVYIHGGGFRGGDKSDIPNEIIEACLNAGISFMTVNYRFLPEAPIQDIMRDCARSIQFVRHNAKEYGIDKKRVASFGGSAGAGTSVWLAFHDDLADPKNDDPVLRESTRIVAAGSLNGQATYDLVEWEQKVGPFKPEWTKPEEAPEFYHLKDRAEMESEKGAKIRKDCSMLGWASKDDPAVFIF
ncbi:MAG TPA: alpha/beta hydrolase, partial [Roseimicrobium sp.]|nr:alpha/beta hydrolase [Roseimicrobium sp.]